MATRDLETTWQDLAGEVLSGFYAWRAQHPTAMLSEIEQALDERWARARARVVQDAALASAATEWRRGDRRPACPTCGGAMHADGVEERRLTTTGDHTLTLRRARARCPVCGTGFFPPR